jgi:hypothetical protein
VSKKFGSARLSALKKSGYLHLKKESKTGTMNGEIRGRTGCGRTGRGKPALGE